MVVCIIALVFLFGISLNGCKKDDLKAVDDKTVHFNQNLSSYHIFKGNPADLAPDSGLVEYTLATTLFSDYAEKQRLIRLPKGTVLNRIDDELPDFPDGTMIVKTFYYYNDSRNTAEGKQIIETRLLIKANGAWNPATYLWNAAQNDGELLESGLNKTVNWVDASGKQQVISYHVPNVRECATCHHSGDSIIPIGPKIRNLNFSLAIHGQMVNQLKHLQEVGLFSPFNPSGAAALPQAFNTSFSLSDRARAYLEINCAHCHNPNGAAGGTDLFMQYKLPLDQTDIEKRKDKILKKFRSGEMPQLGTTIVDQEGLALINSYVESLP